MERARRSASRTRLVEEICIPGRSQARGGKRNHIKDGDPYRNKNLSFISLKRLTIREQQPCNLVNVNVSINLLIVECNFCFFHKTLSSGTRSLFSWYPYQIRHFLDLVTPI